MGTKRSVSGKSKKSGAAPKAASSAGAENARNAAITDIQRLEGKSITSNAKRKTGKGPMAPKAVKPKRVSALDAAAQIIACATKPMRSREMIELMEAKGLWKSPGGKTPEATLYAAIIREIAAKGVDARFQRHDKGLFVAGKQQ
ncbi:HTH domain-containing protein [Leptolyngbya sp. 7M]|uniref:HTH domain-containing protein n=1 Tax=Leptolyngbya sp. 7M TaxID=2812896 RepID=UPI001B8B1B43|nr:HTH domain-containing protein [Leptolyngbya sp. 7M]QYO64141.1 winged helix-turn-helix domain-containing protein [Leptolyngbya sp. 7M]QYU69213.1 winged helix-turn-helix domain-containing protein [Leptolyngbya sp. 15MV]